MESMMNSFNSPESVILNQLFGVLNDALSSGAGNLSELMYKLGSGAMKIAATLLVHRLYAASTKGGMFSVSSLIRWVMIKLFYRAKHLNILDERDRLIMQSFTALIQPPSPVASDANVIKDKAAITPPPPSEEHPMSNSVSGLPMYLDKHGVKDYVLYYLPYFHTEFVGELEREANDVLTGQQVVQTVCIDTAGKVYTPLDLFASNNYLKLDRIVHGYFRRHTESRMITPPIIVLNSMPGIGKSHSAHFLAMRNKYSEVRHISLIQPVHSVRPFPAIIKDLMDKRSVGTTVIYFDELDKYVEIYTYYSFHTSNKADVMDTDYDSHVRKTKHTILMTIAELNNNFTNFPKGVVFVFCSNNFHTLFDGLDESQSMHTESIKTRFTFIDFEMCDSQEFKRYINEYNSRLISEDIKYTQEQMSECLSRVRDDIYITYRDIQILHTKCEYDLNGLVDSVNQGVIHRPLKTNTIASPSNHFSPTQNNKEPTPLVVPPKRVSVEERRQIRSNLREVCMKARSVIHKHSKATEDECVHSVLEILAGYDVIEMMEMKHTDMNMIIDDGDGPMRAYKDHEFTLLHEVCANGRYKLLEHIISLGVDVHMEGSNGETALTTIISGLSLYLSFEKRQNAYKCIDLLMNAGCEITKQTKTMYYPLSYIDGGYSHFEKNDVDMLMSFVRREKPTSFPAVAFFVSFESGADAIRECVQMGYDVHGYSDYVPTLHSVLDRVCITQKTFLDVFKALVECGYNIGKETGTFQTTLAIRNEQKLISAKDAILQSLTYLIQNGLPTTLQLEGKVVTIDEVQGITQTGKEIYTALMGN